MRVNLLAFLVVFAAGCASGLPPSTLPPAPSSPPALAELPGASAADFQPLAGNPLPIRDLPRVGEVLDGAHPFWARIAPAYRKGMRWAWRITGNYIDEPNHQESKHLEIFDVVDGQVWSGSGIPNRRPDPASGPFIRHLLFDTYTFLGSEDVTVPAGRFEGALKFEVHWGSGAATPGSAAPGTAAGYGLRAESAYGRFQWIVPGIGLVKASRLSSDEGQDYGAVEELTYFTDGRKLILPKPSPISGAVPDGPPIPLGPLSALPDGPCAVPAAGGPFVSTLAGGGAVAVTPEGNLTFRDGPAAVARFIQPTDVAVDPRTGIVYVADGLGHRLRAVLPNGDVRTVAGDGEAGWLDGQGLTARFRTPTGLAVDGKGNVFVADAAAHCIRKVNPDGGVSTVAGDGVAGTNDGPAATARFDGPRGIAVDAQGNLYVVDGGSHRIRKVAPDGTTTTLAVGAPNKGLPGFGYANDIAVDEVGNVYFSSGGQSAIHRLTPAGELTVLVGGSRGFQDGPLDQAQLGGGPDLVYDGRGGLLMGDNFRVRRLDLAQGTITTLAGGDTREIDGRPFVVDGRGADARFGGLAGLAIDPCGTIYVADVGSRAIRRLSFDDGASAPLLPPRPVPTRPADGLAISFEPGLALPAPVCPPPSGGGPVVSTVAGSGKSSFGDGPAREAHFRDPRDLAVDRRTGIVYVADDVERRVRAILPNGDVRTVAGDGVAADGTSAAVDGQGVAARFASPSGIAADAQGNLYVADAEAHRIRKIDGQGRVTTLAGDGTKGTADGRGAAARFDHPQDVAVDAQGNVYVADFGSCRLRRVAPDGTTTTLAVGDPDEDLDTFGYLTAVEVGDDGTVYFATEAEAIYRLAPGGQPSLLSKALMPFRLALDGRGGLYVTEVPRFRVQRIDLASGDVTLVAGAASDDLEGVQGLVDGPGRDARFGGPTGLAFDACGNLYVGDAGNNLIRRITF